LEDIDFYVFLYKIVASPALHTLDFPNSCD
jgi:hypothetical protein